MFYTIDHVNHNQDTHLTYNNIHKFITYVTYTYLVEIEKYLSIVVRRSSQLRYFTY